MRRYRDRAKRFRASAAKTKKRTDRPALIQLAQLCDILADGIEAQLRADADQCALSGVKRTLIGHGSMSAFDPKRTLATLTSSVC